jgi:uncharacterized membrane protein HdeD (DUF308 family)
MVRKAASSYRNLKIMGIIAIVLGVISIAAPAVAAGAVVIIVGLTMLATGIAELVQGFRGELGGDKIMPITLGLISSISGVLVLGHPLLGLGFLTLLLVMFFVLAGIWKIITSFKFRAHPGWIWMLLSGTLSLVFGLLIWNQWPLSGVWAIGILVGVELLTTGMSLVILGSAVKDLAGADL